MWPSRQRNRIVHLFGKRVLLIFLLGAAIILFSGVWKVARKERESSALRRQAEAELNDLRTRESQLTAAISQLQTDRGKEQVLREQYALAAEGEGVVIIVDTEDPAPPAPTTTEKTWLEKFLKWW